MKQLETLIGEYLRNCQYIKKLDSKTLKAYRIDLAQFSAFMIQYPLCIDKSVLNEYISSLHQMYKPKTVKRKNTAIKVFYQYLIYKQKLTECIYNIMID